MWNTVEEQLAIAADVLAHPQVVLTAERFMDGWRVTLRTTPDNKLWAYITRDFIRQDYEAGV